MLDQKCEEIGKLASRMLLELLDWKEVPPKSIIAPELIVRNSVSKVSDKGGYEVTECFLAPEWQEIYERKANEIIRKLLSGRLASIGKGTRQQSSKADKSYVATVRRSG